MHKPEQGVQAVPMLALIVKISGINKVKYHFDTPTTIDTT